MILRTLCFSAFALAIATPADTPPPQEVIASIQKRAIASFQRPANCVCRQTIERSPGSPMQVEVGLIDGREQYSWPGSKKVEDSALNTLIKTGAAGTGAYTVYPQNLFQKRGARFQFKGQEKLDGRKVYRFDFVVPSASSSFTLTDGIKKYVVGYHGSVFADTQSYDLVRVHAAADDIPAEAGITDNEDRIDYQQVKLADDDFILPKTVERKVTSTSGKSQTIGRFEACHPFSAEALGLLAKDESADDQEEKKPEEQVVVRVAPRRSAAAAPAKSAPAVPMPVEEKLVPNVEVPAGLRLEMALVTPIMSDDGAKVGDPVTATLAEPLVARGKVLFPEGAQLTGTISVIEPHRWELFDFYVIGVRFDWIVDGTSRAAFSADLEEARLAPAGYTFLPYAHLSLQDKSAWNNIPMKLQQPKYNEGVFWRRGGNLVLSSGLRMLWITTRPKKR